MRHSLGPLVLALLVLVLRPAPGAAQGARADIESADAALAGRASASLAMARRAGAAPVLDGRLDDAAWRDVPVIDRFLEYEPVIGAETRFRTEVRVTYDDRHLYIAARMHDPAPDSIISLLSRRDVRTPSEQLKVVIDSYHDRRTAYQFCVNPAGVKRDYYVYNDNIEDASWDAVWDVATTVDSLGWTAEFRIPLSQLRFPDRAEHTFGLLIVRDVARTNQRISWPLYRRDRQGYVAQAGDLGGITGLPSPRRLEVAPYVVTKNVSQAPTSPGAGWTHPQQQAFGADIKWGLSSNFTVDATVNPDFGQVEADPAILNLSAFEQFFEERRPFFIEGAGIFNFRTDCTNIESSCRGLFYSRRIGRSPQLSGLYGNAASPVFSTIAGAAKLSGRTASGLNIGVLDAVTQREVGTQGRTIEPASNNLVVRMLQDLRGGQSGIGFMLTAVNRDLDPLSAPYLRRAAYSGGIDLRHRFGRGNYELNAVVSASHVRGDTAAIRRLQEDGVHRYQRPDDGIAVDPTRTSLSGSSQRLSLGKYGGGMTRFQTVYQRFTPGLEINDLGFQPRADDQMFRNWFAFSLLKPTRYYRRGEFNFNTWNNWSTAGLPTQVGVNFNWHLELPVQHWLHLGGTLNHFAPVFDDRVARGGPAVRRSSRGNMFAGWEGDRRRLVIPAVFTSLWSGDEGRTRGISIDPSLEFRLTSRFSASLGVSYIDEVNGWQWLRNTGPAGAPTTRYLFARLEQETFRLTTRVNVTMTPTLTLQVWAQPFITTGRYDQLRALSATPRAERFDDRFVPEPGDPRGFDVRELRSNTVLRWEYRRGSTLFLVWQHGRSGSSDQPGRFDGLSEFDQLFSLHPTNTVLLKVAYWLNP